MPQSHLKQSRTVWVLLATAAALTIAIGFLFFNSQMSRLRIENSLLQQQLQLFDLQTRSQQTQLEAEQIITQTQLRNATNLTDLKVYFLHPQSDAPTDASASVIWIPAQTMGLIFTENLPSLSENQKYRLEITSLSTDEKFDCGSFSANEATPESPFQFAIPAGIATDQHRLQFSVHIETADIDSSPPQVVLSTN